MSIMKQKLAFTLVALLSVSALSGCAQTYSSSSFDRETIYESVDDMNKDSDAAVIGKVVKSRQVTDIPGSQAVFTIFEFELVQILNMSSQIKLQPGETIEVRQFGANDSETDPPPVTLLEEEETYLLFLTTSGLEGALASQFYVTGASAGLYELDQSLSADDVSDFSKLSFQQVQPNEEEPELRIVEVSEIR